VSCFATEASEEYFGNSVFSVAEFRTLPKKRFAKKSIRQREHAYPDLQADAGRTLPPLIVSGSHPKFFNLQLAIILPWPCNLKSPIPSILLQEPGVVLKKSS